VESGVLTAAAAARRLLEEYYSAATRSVAADAKMAGA
jgi:hypothetical protein